MRDYNWRIENEQRVVKRRIISTVYAHSYYNPNLRNNRRHFYPEDKWFNYLGEYYQKFKSSGDDFGYRRWYDGEWKYKYGQSRVKSKTKIYKELNDEIGEKYHIRY